MTPDRWREVERLYHEVLARPEGERSAFLREACAGDEALRAEVESLSAQLGVSAFLETPAVAATGAALTSPSPSLVGRHLGPYQITGLLGAGGMGEVYQAHDTRLGRIVALKILRVALHADPELAHRFTREARTLAALSHPQICPVFDVGRWMGSPGGEPLDYLVMEYVDGQNLADRLVRGALPVNETLAIATQIAEALEAAHGKGIIHRDLKPANIMITPAGVVKVLDFGLAKAAAGDHVESNWSTVAGRETRDGVILGTARYMSPEQARGKPVDRRTDIWAFGCVLYEMLTGHGPFGGETLSDTIAAVLDREPGWDALPPTTPASIRRLLPRCLQKDPARRLRDIGDTRFEIDEALAAPAPTAATARSAPRRVAVALVSMLTVSVVALWAFWRAAPEARTVRFDVTATDGATVAPYTPNQGPRWALSPDGRMLAFVAVSEGQRRIWVRPLDTAAAHPLPGTEEARGVFWSPDSQYLAFFTQVSLKKVGAAGGPPVVICTGVESGVDGAWNKDNVILIGTTHGPLLRVSSVGGQPVAASTLENDLMHFAPDFLPDTRHFLYTGYSLGDDVTQTYVGTLDSKERRPVTGVREVAKYSPTGHVLFVRDDTLMAQPFDVTRLDVAGEAAPVAEHVAAGPAGGVSLSANGSLVFGGGSLETQLAWFDRTGKQLGIVGPKGEYSNPELSPDGQYVAFSRGGDAEDLWIRDLQKGQDSRFTSHPAAYTPIWSPDGHTIAFWSNRDGPAGNIYIRAVGVVGEDTRLLKSAADKTPTDWSRDGQYLTFQSDGDLWAIRRPLSGDPTLLRVTETPFTETEARMSPDGRWIAYTSSQSGRRLDVYLQSFPGPGVQVLVSTGGGRTPRWKADGRELYYIAPDFTLMAAAIQPADSSPGVGVPIRLFQTRMYGPAGIGRDYSVSADGRFLINVNDAGLQPITVIVNWPAALKK